MAILNPNEIFYTAFEPRMTNRFILYMDGMPSFLVKGMSAINLSQTAVALNHINVQRYVKGKTIWGTVSFTMYEAITPAGSQTVMEWVRLHHESVTGRDGYSDFYKKDLTIDVLGPVGDVVSEWIIKGAFIKDAAFGDMNWDDDTTVMNISLTIGMDYCVLNF